MGQRRDGSHACGTKTNKSLLRQHSSEQLLIVVISAVAHGPSHNNEHRATVTPFTSPETQTEQIHRLHMLDVNIN